MCEGPALTVIDSPQNAEHAYSGSTDWGNCVRVAWQLAPVNVSGGIRTKAKPGQPVAWRSRSPRATTPEPASESGSNGPKPQMSVASCNAPLVRLHRHVTEPAGRPEPEEREAPAKTNRS